MEKLLNRKGQYMAIEAVLSLGLSLIVAIAAIAVFSGYRGNVMDTIEERHVTIIQSEVLTAVYNLKEADEGSSVSLNLPSTDRADGYRLSFEDRNFVVETGAGENIREINGVQWVDEFSGSASSTEIQILKTDDEILMRPG